MDGRKGLIVRALARRSKCIVACAIMVNLWPWLCTIAAADQHARVLMVSAYSEALPAVERARNAIRNRLGDKSPNTEVFYEALDLAQFPGKAHQDRAARFLADKYA